MNPMNLFMPKPLNPLFWWILCGQVRVVFYSFLQIDLEGQTNLEKYFGLFMFCSVKCIANALNKLWQENQLFALKKI